MIEIIIIAEFIFILCTHLAYLFYKVWISKK